MGARDRSGAPSSSTKYKQLATLFASSVAKGSGCPGTFIELGESFKFSGKPEAALKPFRVLHAMLRGVDNPGQQPEETNVTTNRMDCYADTRILEVNEFPKQVFKRRGNYISLHKLAHDVEQLEYLTDKFNNTGVLNALTEFKSLATNTASILAAKGIDINKPGDDREMKLQEPWVSRLAPHTDRALHIVSAPALAGPAVTPCNVSKRSELEEQYSDTGVVYTDNFLTPQALASLREFCLDSTMWYDMKNVSTIISGAVHAMTGSVICRDT